MRRFLRTAVVVTHCVTTLVIAYAAVATATTADSDVLVPQIFLWSLLSVILVATLIVVARNPLNAESLSLLAISIVGAVNASITSQVGLDGPFAPITYDLVFVSIFIAPVAGIVGLIRLFR